MTGDNLLPIQKIPPNWSELNSGWRLDCHLRPCGLVGIDTKNHCNWALCLWLLPKSVSEYRLSGRVGLGSTETPLWLSDSIWLIFFQLCCVHVLQPFVTSCINPSWGSIWHHNDSPYGKKSSFCNEDNGICQLQIFRDEMENLSIIGQTWNDFLIMINGLATLDHVATTKKAIVCKHVNLQFSEMVLNLAVCFDVAPNMQPRIAS